MKQIPIKGGKVALVDDADYESLIPYKWRLSWGYAVRMSRAKEGGRRRVISMSRFIAGAREGETVDHINRDRLDNRRANLRLCSQGENNLNKGVRKDNQTGHKNIRRHQGKFQVRIKRHGKVLFRKEFNTLDEAILARSVNARLHHGEFANN